MCETKSSMNIAIIDNNIFAVNSIRAQLIQVLIAKGYCVTVLTSGTLEQLQEASKKGFVVVDIGSSVQNPLHILCYLLRMYWALKAAKIDLCLTFTIRPAIWGNIVCRVAKIPTVTNITGIGPLFNNGSVAYKGARILYRSALRRSAKIFFQNNDDLQIFIQKGFADPAVSEKLAGSGVDHEHYAPQEKEGENGKFNFLFISRLVKDKGIVEYVNAARMLKEELPNAVFSVLGPLWSQNLKHNTVTKDELDQWVKEGTIVYLGETEDTRDFIAQADCVVLPSYREGASNVLLEASSMERPCITCNTTGCKEIVEDGVTGYLCRVRDPKNLTDKMRKMFYLSDQERIEMGKRGRQKVIREFDRKVVINTYLTAIEQIINK